MALLMWALRSVLYESLLSPVLAVLAACAALGRERERERERQLYVTVFFSTGSSRTAESLSRSLPDLNINRVGQLTPLEP